MIMTQTIKKQIIEALNKTRIHLKYSFNKVNQIDMTQDLSEEQLESLESFSSRFARFSDPVIRKYFQTLAIEKDPAFKGSVIDLLNQAEKFNWIQSATTWRRIRELRNVAAHEYTSQNYKALYQELIKLTPNLLDLNLNL